MILDWKTLPRPIAALSPMADMTDSAFCRAVRAATPSVAGAISSSPPGRIVRAYEAKTKTPAEKRVPQQEEEELAAGTPLIVFREMVSSEAVVRGNDKTLGM